MPFVYITRHLHFNAAHRLHSDLLSDSENQAIYGACNNPLGHGHNYELEVTVVGEPDPVTGMVIDLKVLKEIVEREVISQVDHKHLNFDVDFMRGIVPTAENIVVVFWKRLQGAFDGCRLYELKLWETPRNVAIYRGEQSPEPA
ncbi:MAG TPA: 6-carboxytetrahydropterin synthase [bacterium]|nr:6-carboxytetrahydropterin synthase [bacterium]HQG44757.1 6-carboxytetrahydropterin synthase [bacterium]HQI48183.1 6-carboxytetrahydropterin synthase [bacterium]HQJ64556.1 6-carboxytetrahydropterin synthase [bacterium]